jgi:hypothetical protein
MSTNLLSVAIPVKPMLISYCTMSLFLHFSVTDLWSVKIRISIDRFVSACFFQPQLVTENTFCLNYKDQPWWDITINVSLHVKHIISSQLWSQSVSTNLVKIPNTKLYNSAFGASQVVVCRHANSYFL